MTQIVWTILHPKGNRKVEIFRRENGTFGFEEWKLWDEPENSWAPYGRYSTAIIDTFDRALKEVEGRVSWVERSDEWRGGVPPRSQL